MILVIGSTGTTGGEVARQLIALDERPRLLVRSAEKASAFKGKAEILEGDLNNSSSLATALRGIDKVFLVSTGVGGPALEKKLIDSAKHANVKHIVKLSVLGTDDPKIALAKWHADAEKHLMSSGIAWTMLRPGDFMTNMLGWAGTIRSQGAFYQPTGDGKWASIDPADIGAVAAKALTSAGHEGKTYAMTGPESMSASQYAEKLSVAIGKPVKFVNVPPEAAKDGMLGSGMPPVYVDAILELMASVKAGHTDRVFDDAIQTVLGRAPTRFEDWAKRHAAAFA